MRFVKVSILMKPHCHDCFSPILDLACIFSCWIFQSFLLKVLNAIEFESLSVSRFRVNSDGFYSLNISSIIVLWGSRISLHGMYDGSNKTYAFSMASLQDSKPMTLISMIPALASVPVRGLT